MTVDAAREWLLQKVATTREQRLSELLRELLEQLFLATSEGASLRRLSGDGLRLPPVAWYHPHQELRDSVPRIMEATAAVEDSGTWRSVVRERQVIRYHVPSGRLPVDVSAVQSEVLTRYRVRAGIAAPVIGSADEVVGGVALIRFGVDAPFTDRDEELLTTFAAEVSGLVDVLRRIVTD
ncbi:GAF domain-containing protein [Quadrisphaera granulorum]|uniref:GAF domain-containing protein n=1 Tax=Quadrisphaera granulorum TaxID=317664 RepID=A0A315ZUF6_9ACTN|nr:GAF domain-containing protein [Quadrisphaera granulorum]PWJ48843.1 GAF domain-containing protein [Quadrisphaera granulorum]SZE98325.1 GAF domain-containing protein [Quadrisphaera granulorum]